MEKQQFTIGDTLKFSDKGINIWLDGRRGFFEPARYRHWRWRVEGFKRDFLDKYGNPMLLLKRTDAKGWRQLESWSSVFFERA